MLVLHLKCFIKLVASTKISTYNCPLFYVNNLWIFFHIWKWIHKQLDSDSESFLMKLFSSKYYTRVCWDNNTAESSWFHQVYYNPIWWSNYLICLNNFVKCMLAKTWKHKKVYHILVYILYTRRFIPPIGGEPLNGLFSLL